MHGNFFDTHVRMRELFFGKFGVLCFLVTLVLRFVFLLPFRRNTSLKDWKKSLSKIFSPWLFLITVTKFTLTLIVVLPVGHHYWHNAMKIKSIKTTNIHLELLLKIKMILLALQVFKGPISSFYHRLNLHLFRRQRTFSFKAQLCKVNEETYYHQ